MAESKNSVNGPWRTTAIFCSLLLMTAATAVSRGALSVSIIAFVFLALFHKNFLAQLKTFIATPFLFSLSLLFFIPFVSGLWSDDLGRWTDVVRIKLPLLFLPLAFAGNWQLSTRQRRAFALLFLALVFSGCLWGLIDYGHNAAQVHADYLRAKTLRTPLEDDHVRFSWLVSVAVIFCVWAIETTRQKAGKMLFFLFALLFTTYLHVLSARTGLLSLYIFLFMYATYAALKMKARKQSLFLLCALAALPLLAYVALPTFRARLQYNRYDLSFAKKAQYLPGSSDGARTMSLKAGWQVLKEAPFGVGAGDVMHEADKWYAANVPNVLPSDKFYPSSEWLMYGAFAGWPGVVLITAVLFVPFFAKTVSAKIFWSGFHATAAFSFAFDMGLEVQYGVFLYGFLACGLWKALVKKSTQ